MGNSAQVLTSVIIDKLFEAQGRQLGVSIPKTLSHRETPQYCEFYLQELYSVNTVNTEGKYPCAFRRRRGERNYFEICQSTVILKKSSLRRNYFTNPLTTGVFRVQPKQRKGNIQLLSTLNTESGKARPNTTRFSFPVSKWNGV